LKLSASWFLNLHWLILRCKEKKCKTMKRQKKQNFEQSKNSHTGRDKEYLPMVRDIL